jgi:hypothetical protein
MPGVVSCLMLAHLNGGPENGKLMPTDGYVIKVQVMTIGDTGIGFDTGTYEARADDHQLVKRADGSIQFDWRGWE